MAEMKKQNKAGGKTSPASVIRGIVVFLLFVIAGFIGGMALGERMESMDGKGFLAIAGVFICVFIGYFLAIILHEAGHMVMGLLTGYKFLSFRIGSLTLVKTAEGFQWKKFSIAGTGGQCLMIPPETENPEAAPYFWYHAGGGLFNLLTALLCIPFILLTNGWVNTFFLLFAIVSAATALTNLIPLRTGQISNDGGNILQMKQSPYDRGAIWRQFMINARQTLGECAKDMPEYLFDAPEKGGSYIGASMLQLRGMYFVEQRDFVTAETLFEACAEHPEVLDIHKNEALCELLFCKIMNHAPAEEIEALYDKKLQNYVKATGKYYVSRKRLLYAHYLLHKGDAAAAEQEYAQAQKMRSSYPVIGELESELAMMEYVKMQFQQ